MNEETMRLEAQAEWKNGEIEELKVILVKYELLSSGYVSGMAMSNRIWDGNMTDEHSTGGYKDDAYKGGGYKGGAFRGTAFKGGEYESDDHDCSGGKYY
jgi:uncharacterized membrane protein